MVKADVRRDYYADLGLAPSADPEDIKKQFRKLALKYHPDRNPGKEIEFNSKFQAIQAAHEILVDPTQRLKYDTDRLRAGYGKFYGPPKPNNIPRKQPYTPPKTQNRKPAYSGRPTSFQNANTNASAPGGGGAGGPGGGGGGAQRYASYAKAAPHQSWQKTQDHGQTRADAFRGFQDMKGSGAGGMPGWNQFDPRTGRTGQSRPNDGQSQSARPKSAYEYFKSAYNMPKPDPARRKHGFAPRTAGGDEPMAPNTSAYTSTPRENNRWSDYFESVPPPTARKPTAAETAQAQAQAQTQPQPQGDRFGSFAERASSRYATAGGEKTFFSSAGLGRSATVRDPPQRSRSPSRGFPSNADSSTGRHRSASPKVKRESTSSTSSSDMDEERPPFQPKIPKSKLRPNQKYSDFRTRQDRRSGNGHDSDSAAFPKGSQRPFQFTQGAPNFTDNPSPTEPQGAFKSSSHGDLHNRFNAEDWHGAFQDDFVFSGVFPPAGNENRHRASPKNGFSSQGTTSGSASDASRPTSASQKPTTFAEDKFVPDDWIKQFSTMSWAMPKNDGSHKEASSAGSRSPRKQSRTAKRTGQAPSVATEAEEAKTTVDGSGLPTGGAGEEAMDIDEDQPIKQPGPEKQAQNQKGASQPKPSPNDSRAKHSKAENSMFNMNNLGKTDPFTNTNSTGINNLQDIHATLPFESRTKSSSTIHNIRPRDLDCPNPPKRPRLPPLLPISTGSTQLTLTRTSWNRYVAEMNTYMREWNEFNGKMLGHFNARHEAVKTGLAPGWIGAVGDSTRLNLNQLDVQDDRSDRDDGDVLVPGSAKGGYSAYLRGLEEDVKVRKHWEVACELHQECIMELGQIREWIRNGGRLSEV